MKITEGKQLTKMLGRYSSGTDGSDNTILLEAWSGDTIAILRQDIRKCLKIANPCLTIAATVQPHNLQKCFSVDDVMEGLMQRMLVYGGDEVPDSADPDAGKEFREEMSRYTEAICRIRNLRQNLGSEVIRAVQKQDPLAVALNCDPIRLVLDDAGNEIWREYARFKRSSDASEIYPSEHPFRTDMLRHAEYALRIAAGLFMLDQAVSDAQWMSNGFDKAVYFWLPSRYLKNAIVLMEWLWAEKQRLMASMVEDRFMKANPEESLKSMVSLPEVMERHAERRRRILSSRMKGQDTWTVRDFQRYLRVPNADIARAEVACLLRSGLIRQVGETHRSPRFTFQIPERPPSRAVRE